MLNYMEDVSRCIAIAFALILLSGCVGGSTFVRPTDNIKPVLTRALPKNSSLQDADALNEQAIALLKQGKQAEAIPLAEQALTIREQLLGQDNADVAASLNNLAELYRIQGEYARAETLCLRALAIREKILAPDHIDIAGSLNNLAVLYFMQAQYDKAEPLYQRVLKILEATYGLDNPNVATGLNNLAELYRTKGEYTKAEPLYKRALAIREQIPNSDREVARSLNALALLYQTQGQYASAEPLYQRALSIQEKSLGSNHTDVANTLNNIALLYEKLGQYLRAEPLYQRSLKIFEQANHPSVASSLNNLAQLYYAQGSYDQAEPLLKRALEIREQTLDAYHTDVAVSLNNLAELYRAKNQYDDAEPLYQRAMAIWENKFGHNHPSVATILSNMALLYRSQNQYGRAGPLLQNALKIKELAVGSEHPDVATNLSNLASMHLSQQEYGQAEPLYQRALAIDEKAFGTNHVTVATDLNNLAELYRIQKDYGKAESLYQRALMIYEKTLGTTHPLISNSLNNLALLYSDQGQYARSLPLYERALAIREQALGSDHPDVAASLNNLAVVYENQGQHISALEFIRKAGNIYRGRIFSNSQAQSSGAENERTQFINTFDIYLSIAAACLAEDPNLLDELVNESFEMGQLFHDGKVGDALARMAARVAAGNSGLESLARDKEDTKYMWQKAEADFVTAISKPPSEQNQILIQSLRTRERELKQKLAALNQRLAQEFPDYAELTVPKPVTLKQVQRQLKSGEALVAYVLGKTMSFVWLVTADDASFRPIFLNQGEIDSKVRTLRTALSPDSNPNMGPFPVAEANTLFKDIFGSEAKRSADVKTIFIVADGALESLPFAVLVTEPPTGDITEYQKMAWFSRRWATATLPTVSSLVALRNLASKRESAALPFIGFGDPDFTGNANNGQRGTGGVRLLGSTNNGPTNNNILGEILAPLPETADELRAIAQTLGGGTNSIYLRDQATVPTVNTIPLANYRVIHFATHALVAGQIEEYKLGQAEPAIALSPPQVTTVENDGLLRASQVAKLKLNADWVVLSACNTAAPDGTPGAVGLSGLAKAFFYAGAKAMLVSHWSVISKPAVVLTTGMFKVWRDNPELGRAEALRQAEMAILDNPTEPYFTHPAAWAPFVVAGEGGVGR